MRTSLLSLDLSVPEASAVLARYGWEPSRSSPVPFPVSRDGASLPLTSRSGSPARHAPEGGLGLLTSTAHLVRSSGVTGFPEGLRYLEALEADVSLHRDAFEAVESWLEGCRLAARRGLDPTLVELRFSLGALWGDLDVFLVSRSLGSGEDPGLRGVLLVPAQVATHLLSSPPPGTTVLPGGELSTLFVSAAEAETTLSLWEPGSGALFSSFARAHEAARDLLS